MKTAGIIAEYNPFHNGHQFHIEETRKRTNADYIIAAISGDYVQRGAPAILDKYTRTRMALSCGADMVFELPVTAALSSAEGFAEGGVSLLNGLGVVDVISCGCESVGENTEFFHRVISLIAEDSPQPGLSSSSEKEDLVKYQSILRDNLKRGINFPSARQIAVEEVLSPEAAALLSQPNDILALEYAKAISKNNCGIELCLVPRQGEAHHSNNISVPSSGNSIMDEQISAADIPTRYTQPSTTSFSSASAIRKLLLSDEGNINDKLISNVPLKVFHILTEAQEQNCFLREDDFSDMLYHALIMNRDCLSDFGPTGSDLARRTTNLLEHFTTWSDFVSLLKTKNQTWTAISRYLARIMLGLTRDDLTLTREIGAPYARLLGFRRETEPLLSQIKRSADIPIIIQTADDVPALSDDSRHIFDLNVRASELYRHILCSHSGQRIRPELRQGVIVI